MYNRPVESHPYLEIIEQDNSFIILFSDDGTNITKETHTYDIVEKGIGFLKKGSVVESVTTETASGSWEDRYELEYSSSLSAPTEEPTPETQEAGAGDDEVSGDGQSLDGL